MPSEPTLRTPDGPIMDTTAQVVLTPVFRDGPTETETLLDAQLGGVLHEMRERRELRFGLGEVTFFPTLKHVAAERVALVGGGKRTEFTTVTATRAMSAACRHLATRRVTSLAVSLSDWPLAPQAAARHLALGAAYSTFDPGLYRRRGGAENEDSSAAPAIAELQLHDAAGMRNAADEGIILGRAFNLAREMTQEPGNILDPTEMARRASELGREAGLEIEIMGLPEIEAKGMGAVLAVTQGSSSPARIILLRHHPHPGEPELMLIGKAVTFDSGGISLKPSADMGKMKGDMAGGAAVIAAMWAIGRLALPVNVSAIVPASSNMPDGSAWRPGDVIRAMDGHTIETISTDAEGRMLLADALTLALESAPKRIVDIATLTGACVVALGHAASGLFGTSEALLSDVQAAGAVHGEVHWPMPLLPEYRAAIRSDVADLKNSGGRPAGAATAASFLREFAGDAAWAHLDIAGTSQYEKNTTWAPAGPSGVGVGTFVELARRLSPSG